MNEARAIPQACEAALAALEADPLSIDAATQAHLRVCPACAEARVQWLALEDAPFALAPAGYFDHLPTRILRKLPTRANHRPQMGRWVWAAAAVLLMTGVGVTGFWLGRANQHPMVEATLPRTPREVQELLPEAPFQDTEDAMSQLSDLSKADAEAVLQRMETPKNVKP